MKKEENSFGIASVVLGIVSLVSSGGLLLAIVGLVFANKQAKISANKWSRAGKILGILGIAVGIISLGLLFILRQKGVLI